jgi:hypothetical protein
MPRYERLDRLSLNGSADPDQGRANACGARRLAATEPHFVVSAPTKKRIAHSLTATSVKLDVSAKAPKERSDLHDAVCDVLRVHGPNYDFPYSTEHGFPLRLYFATLRSARRRTRS